MSTQASAPTIGDALRAVVDERPDAVALHDDERDVTFAEFEQITNHTAATLLERLEPCSALALIAHKNIRTASILVGAAKAGLTTVVIDPREPVSRLVELYERGACSLLVETDAERRADARMPTALASDLEGTLRERPATSVRGDDVAGIFFTSGSTGAAKGIAITHANIVRRAQLQADDVPGVQRAERYAWLGSLAFGCASALFTSLLRGATGYIFDIERVGVRGIVSRLHSERITFLTCAPTVLRSLADVIAADAVAMDHVRLVGLGGEALRPQDAEVGFGAFPSAQLRHSYGASESGAVASNAIERGTRATDGFEPVGRVLPWNTVEILDERGQPVGPGEAGEIVISSGCVALGYVGEGGLTVDQFPATPQGLRRFHTGDTGMLADDGHLKVEGRSDDQVKVRGQRVDLGIVTHALMEQPEIVDATVIAEGGRLVAFVVPKPNHDATVRALRDALADRIPQYMIPAEYFILPTLPRTQRDKVDRTALRSIRADAAARRGPHVAPESDTEIRVSRMFEELLHVERVGRDEDFFDLGGDSLGVLELLEMVSDELSIDLHESLLIESTVHTVASVRELARTIDRARAHETADTTHADPSDDAIHVRPDGVALLRVGPQADRDVRLFLVPGAGEGTTRFLPLAKELQHCRVYSFHRRGLHTRDRSDRTIEEMAARLVPAIQSVQPSGPYVVGGFSFGATVAYELAQQIRERGEQVALLVMLDPLGVRRGGRRRRRHDDRARSRVKRYLGAPPWRSLPSAMQAVHRRTERIRTRFGRVSSSRIERAHQLVRLAGPINSNYRPRPYEGHTLVVESTGRGGTRAHRRWAPMLTGSVEWLQLAGPHLEVLEPANAHALALGIDTAIERLELSPRR